MNVSDVKIHLLEQVLSLYSCSKKRKVESYVAVYAVALKVVTGMHI